MNRKDYLASLDIQVETVEFWIAQEWLAPSRDAAEASFSETDVARGRLIQDLTGEFGVNHEGVDIILHLLDQLHGFRRAFEDLHEDLETTRRRGASRE